MTDDQMDNIVSAYNNAYCEQRRAGIGGAEAERAGMRAALAQHEREKFAAMQADYMESKGLPYAPSGSGQ